MTGGVEGNRGKGTAPTSVKQQLVLHFFARSRQIRAQIPDSYIAAARAAPAEGRWYRCGCGSTIRMVRR
jgi:hypothetical protein